MANHGEMICKAWVLLLTWASQSLQNRGLHPSFCKTWFVRMKYSALLNGLEPRGLSNLRAENKLRVWVSSIWYVLTDESMTEEHLARSAYLTR
jgi:hypothetical protein